MIHATQNIFYYFLIIWHVLATLFTSHLWLIPVEIIALAAFVGDAVYSRLRVGQLPVEMIGLDYRDTL